MFRLCLVGPRGILFEPPGPAAFGFVALIIVVLLSLMAAMRGAFVVLEGCDRAGKSTQVARVAERLAVKTKVVAWRFPDRTTPVGAMIDKYLKSEADLDDAAVHLLFAANRHEKKAELQKLLASGTTVVADRYAYSGVAFTMAKNVPGLNREWCKAPDAGLPRPDATIFLHLDTEAAAKRGGFGEERYETTDMQRNVAKAFTSLQDASWTVLDAGQPLDDVTDAIMDAVAPVVQACADGTAGDLRTLWEDDDVTPAARGA